MAKFVFKRLSAVNLVDKIKVVEYHLPETPSGDFIVDDSTFCPMSEAVKQLSRTAPISADEIKMVYDFVDGKDTGMKVPIQRSGHLADITELSTDINDSKKEVQDNLKDIKETVAQREAIEQALSANQVANNLKQTE